MDAKIDYVSFSVMEDVRAGEDEHQQWQRAVNALWERHPLFMNWCSRQGGWSAGGARGHYGYSQFNAQLYAAVRFGGSANHILVELPGTACQQLRDDEILEDVVLEASERLTRLDIAVDIPGGASPLDFVAAGYNTRFDSHAEIISKSGVTAYVGSMKSERYARVYRYEPPHPRAGVTRVEHVLRSDYAKQAAVWIRDFGVIGLVNIVGNSFGWMHPDWQPDRSTNGKLRASRVDRHEPGRVRWLHQVVMPALVKASNEGLIDWAEFSRTVAALIADRKHPGDAPDSPSAPLLEQRRSVLP